MTLDEIRQFRGRTPFEPFEIMLVDGRRFVVPHRDFIFVPAGRDTWVVVWDPKTGIADHINTAVISSIRNVRPAKPRTSRRRKAG